MFCKYCGKQIPDGSTCTCEKAVNAAGVQNQAQPAQPAQTQYQPQAAPAQTQFQPQAALGAAPANESIWMKSLKALPEALKNLMTDCTGKDNNICTGVYFAAFSVISYLLFFLFCFLSLNNLLGGMLGGFFGKMILGTLLILVVSYGISILISIIGQLIRKENVNVVKPFIRSATVSVIPSAILILSGLFFLFAPQIAIFLLLIALCIRLAEFGHLCTEEFGQGKATTLTRIISAVICAIVVAIFFGALYAVVKNEAMNMVGSFMSNSLGGMFG